MNPRATMPEQRGQWNSQPHYNYVPPYLASQSVTYQKDFSSDYYKQVFQPQLTMKPNYKAIKLFQPQELIKQLQNHLPLVRQNVLQFDDQMQKLSLTFGNLISKGFHIDDFLKKFFLVIDKRIRLFFEHLDSKALKTDVILEQDQIPTDYRLADLRLHIRQKLIEISDELVQKYASRVTPIEYDKAVLRKIEAILRVYDLFRYDQGWSFIIQISKFNLGDLLQRVCDNNLQTVNTMQELIEYMMIISMKTIKDQTQHIQDGRTPLFMMNKEVILEKFHAILKDRVDPQMTPEDLLHICKTVSMKDRRIIYNEFYYQINDQLKQLAPEYYQYTNDSKTDYQKQREALHSELLNIQKEWEQLKQDENYYLIQQKIINEDDLRQVPLESEAQLVQLNKLNTFAVNCANLQQKAVNLLKEILDHKKQSKLQIEAKLQESMKKVLKHFDNEIPGRNPYSKQIQQYVDQLYYELEELLHQDPKKFQLESTKLEAQIDQKINQKNQNPYLMSVKNDLQRQKQTQANLQSKIESEMKKKSDFVNAQVNLVINQHNNRKFNDEDTSTRPYSQVSDGKVMHGSSVDYHQYYNPVERAYVKPQSAEPGKYENQVRNHPPQPQISRDPYMSNKGYHVDRLRNPKTYEELKNQYEINNPKQVPVKKTDTPQHPVKQPETVKKQEPSKQTVKQPDPPKKLEPSSQPVKQPDPPKKQEPPQQHVKQAEPPKKPEHPQQSVKQPEPPKKPEHPQQSVKQPEPPKKPETPQQPVKQPEPPKKPEPPQQPVKQPEPPKKPEPPQQHVKQPEPPKKPEPPQQPVKQPEPPKKPEPPQQHVKQPEPPKKPEPPQQPVKQPEPPKKPEPPQQPVKQPEPPKKPEPPQQHVKQPEPPKKPEPPQQPVKQPEPPKKPEPPQQPVKQPEPPKKPEPPQQPVKQPEPPKKPEPPQQPVKQPEPPKKPETPQQPVKQPDHKKPEAQKNARDKYALDLSDDDDFMMNYEPKQKPQAAASGAPANQFQMQDPDQDDEEDDMGREIDKLMPGDDGEDDQPFEQLPLNTKQNLNLLNKFIKSSKLGKQAQQVNLEEFKNYDYMIQLFEEFILKDEAYFFDIDESMMLLEINEKVLQQQDPNQDIEEWMEIIQQNYKQRTSKPQWAPQTKLYFSFDQNPFAFYLLEKDPLQKMITLYFEEDPPEDLLSEEFQGFISIFQQLQDCEDYEISQIVVDPVTLQQFAKYGEDGFYIKYLLTVYAVLYEQQAQIPEVKITYETVERVYWTLNQSVAIYDGIQEQPEEIETFFDNISTKQEKSIGVEQISVEFNEQHIMALAKKIQDIKARFLKEKSLKQFFILIEIMEVESEQKFAYYIHLSRVSQLNFLKLFLLQHYDQMNDQMLAFLLSEDGLYGQKIYIDYARHNFLYEYGVLTLGAWIHLVVKKNLKAEDAMALINLSIAPFNMILTSQD